MTKREDVENFIYKLETEADECEDAGFNFSSSNMRTEADRLQRLLDKGIVPQEIIPFL